MSNVWSWKTKEEGEEALAKGNVRRDERNTGYDIGSLHVERERAQATGDFVCVHGPLRCVGRDETRCKANKEKHRANVFSILSLLFSAKVIKRCVLRCALHHMIRLYCFPCVKYA